MDKDNRHMLQYFQLGRHVLQTSMIKGAKETTNFQVLKRTPTKIDNHQDSAVAKTHILGQMRITFQELKIQNSKFQRIIDYAMKIAKHWVMNLIFTVPWVDMIGYN